MKKKIGSATLVVVLFSVIYMLYATSTYADVRHMKNKYIEYEKEIIEKYETEYNTLVYDL